MQWIPQGNLTWRCDDYKPGYSAVVEPCKEQFKVTIYHNDSKKIAFKNMQPVDAMDASCKYIDKISKENNNGHKSQEQNHQTVW